ncbi:hypothetical protein BCR44DRAFT_1505511 [Catenaria anguillulae PL171]|uniref:Uncharacterized protein n=1 Tax=Catenaria anguillulae PL171 TaxID=765915 RepID=A0A1Y2H6E2_9FUNG|nr:hypothetical protein BCR44DRAFT_1505511 [Catenaria anguillulae PL171]
MQAVLLRTATARQPCLATIAHPRLRSASVLATHIPPATPARASRSVSNDIDIESSLHNIFQELVGFPLALPPVSRTIPTLHSVSRPRPKQSNTKSHPSIPLVDQWVEHLNGIWPHVLAPPAVASRDTVAALIDLQNAVEQGSTSTALQLARSLTPLGNIPTQLRPRFAAIIASCPLVSHDHHADWDTLVAECVQATIDLAHCTTSATANSIQIQLVAHLARAVGKRHLGSHLTHMDQLLRAFHLRPDESLMDDDAA